MIRLAPPIDAVRRSPFSLADVVVILGALTLLAVIAKVAAGAFVAFVPPHTLPTVSTDPKFLPYYAARSTLRMFVALIWSFLFTLVYGYAAARSRRLGRVLIPLLDILQSVPVLGFLSITITGFIALFPGSLLGLEFASIFAIFTAQAWNMTFSFYQSLRTIPQDLDEAMTSYHLSRWERFTRLELPSSAIPLIWNAMMSFGGGWFFLAASEAITVLNKSYTLPGIGSYVAAAVAAKDMRALCWAILTIAIVIFAIDQLFWRPLVAWSDKFRLELSSAGEAPKSWLYDLLRSATFVRSLRSMTAPLRDFANARLSALTGIPKPWRPLSRAYTPADRIYDAALIVAIVVLVYIGFNFIVKVVGVSETVHAVALGFFTLLRVLVLLVIATLVWTPIGVTIGFNPRLAHFAQPIAQFLASFPANFVFPFATAFFISTHISLNFGSVLLMALGSQWYILFNVIAGASAVPNELREMALDMDVRGRLLWKRLIIPGIFGSWVTGAITASGGAWNASIVSEIVSWGHTTLVASGLGAYIAEATTKGDWPRITLGVCVMSLFVVGVNRLVWRRLYKLAEVKYHL